MQTRSVHMRSGWALLGVALLALGGARWLAAEAENPSAETSARAEALQARAAARRVASLAELLARFDRDRRDFTPSLSPDPDFIHPHDGGVLPFAASGFQVAFIDGLRPTQGAGAPRYPIRIAEDRRTRERVIFNAAGDAIARQPAPADYAPRAFARTRFPDLTAEDRRYAARLLAIYDPARIVLDYALVAEADLAAWAAAAAAESARLTAQREEPPMPPLGTPLEGGAVAGLQFVSIASEPGGGRRLSVAWPAGGLTSSALDFFVCPDLAQAPWEIARTVAVDPLDMAFSWVADDQAPSQFFDVWTLHDSDADGLPDGRERRLYGTATHNADTDADGLTDFAEIFVHQTAPGNPDTDADGLTDFAEIVVHQTSPNHPDTDADGLTDFAEIVTHQTSPNHPDTDADGITDGSEVDQGTYPTNPASRPDDEWFILIGDDGEDLAKTRSRTVRIPAGETRALVVAVHSEEFPDWTGQPSRFNDLLEWHIEPAGGATVAGAINVNSRHTQWQAARGKSPLLGFYPVHIEHTALLTAPANAPLTVRITLKATNIGDGRFFSTVMVGLPLLKVELTANTTKEVGKDDHYLKLKNSGDVIVTATLTPSVDPSAISWTGGTPGTDNLRRVVSSAIPGDYDISALVNGIVCKAIRIHVVDASATPAAGIDAPKTWQLVGAANPGGNFGLVVVTTDVPYQFTSILA